jgi:putative hydrolase of the HAD superfamily
VKDHELEGLVFDLDDTLFPERDFVISGFAAAARCLAPRCAFETAFDTFCRLFAAGERRSVFDRGLAELAIPDPQAVVPVLLAAYREHLPAITLFADAAWALQRFRPSHRLGVLTDGYLVTQRRKVEALALAPRVDAVVFSDEFGRERWKPHPFGFERMMALLQLPASRCCYVADNPRKDFTAPRALGWTTIRILRPGGEYAGLTPAEPAHAPDRTIASLHELASLV